MGLAGAVLTALLPGRAADATSLSAFLGAIAAEGGIEASRDIAFGAHPRQRLDIYRAPAGAERKPIVLFLYGGGWTSGDRATYAFVGAALARRGYTTVIPDYRLFPEVQFPAFLDDAAIAWRWVHTTLAGGCGSARPVIVVGHSAGAYIAAMLALDRSLASRGGAPLPQPAALIGLAGPYAFDPTTWPSTKEIFAPAAGRADTARPIAFARHGAPASLLLHGGADDTVQLYNTRDLAAALRSKGGTVGSKFYPGIGHVGLVTAIARPLRWRAPVLTDMLAFMERHGGGVRKDAGCNRQGPETGR
jgi:acetyl esterase/lipase